MGENDKEEILRELGRLRQALEKVQGAKRTMGCYLKEACAQGAVKLFSYVLLAGIVLGVIYFYIWKPVDAQITSLSEAPSVAFEYISDVPSKAWCAMPWTCDVEVSDSELMLVPEIESDTVEQDVVVEIQPQTLETEEAEEEPGLLSWRPKRPEWTKWGKAETEGEESP